MSSMPQGASRVRLSPDHLGICRVPSISDASIAEANRLLQKNHDEIHMFWREANGHNHTAHNLLTSLSLGASPAELQQAYEDDARDQARSKPLLDLTIDLSDPDVFYQKLGKTESYSDYLAFFEQEIDKAGLEAVIVKYCCSHTRNSEALFARLFEGAFHSLIHLGLGVEFQLPSIVAEGLAQAATDASFGMEAFFRDCEELIAKSESALPRKSLAELLYEVHANETTRHGARWEDAGVSKIKAGVLGRAREQMVLLASQFRVDPEALEQRTVEMISSVAYMAGAGQRSGKARKIDFFYMHDVTSSIFLTVLTHQQFIPLADRVRLLEFKGRMDLVWYAACGAPELRLENVEYYVAGPSAELDWDGLFRFINIMHDDGHVAKFARALKHGENMAALIPSVSLPIEGDLWLKLAKMAYDTNVNVPNQAKWIFFAGFDQPWTQVADQISE